MCSCPEGKPDYDDWLPLFIFWFFVGGGRKKDAKGAAAGGGSEEEYDLSDNMSTTSALSDGSVAIVGDNESELHSQSLT